jgi:nitrous oxidase accessory protein NosD
VEIDLNGFTVTNSNGDDCVQVLSSTARLTVRNGTISDCHSGVYAGAATQVVVEDVTVSGTWGGAINVNDVGSVAIRRATVLGSSAYGIGVVSAIGFSHNALIEDCTVQGVASDGIIFQFGSVQIRNNRVTAAGNTGIRVFEATGSEVSGNLVVGSANDVGLLLVATHGSIVSGNIVKNSYHHGICSPPTPRTTSCETTSPRGTERRVSGTGCTCRGSPTRSRATRSTRTRGPGSSSPTRGVGTPSGGTWLN